MAGACISPRRTNYCRTNYYSRQRSGLSPGVWLCRPGQGGEVKRHCFYYSTIRRRVQYKIPAFHTEQTHFTAGQAESGGIGSAFRDVVSRSIIGLRRAAGAADGEPCAAKTPRNPTFICICPVKAVGNNDQRDRRIRIRRLRNSVQLSKACVDPTLFRDVLFAVHCSAGAVGMSTARKKALRYYLVHSPALMRALRRFRLSGITDSPRPAAVEAPVQFDLDRAQHPLRRVQLVRLRIYTHLHGV